MVPDSLREALQDIQQGNRSGVQMPKVLYIIPTGQNPTGSTLSSDRRKEIYAIACKFDLVIIEDDPYFFLNYGPDRAPADEKSYHRPRVDSFFSIDVENRVVRFDSMRYRK